MKKKREWTFLVQARVRGRVSEAEALLELTSYSSTYSRLYGTAVELELRVVGLGTRAEVEERKKKEVVG